MRDVKKIVLVKLEPSEPDPAAGTGFPDSASSASAAAGAVSRHTASCFQRSARRVRRSGMRDQKTVAPPRASAPAPSVDPVRFQFVVIVFVSRGFPLVPVASVSVPGFGSRAGLYGPLSGPSIGFKSVKIVQSRTFVQAPLSRLSWFSPARLSVRLAFASLPLGFSLVSGLAVRLAFASLPLGPAQLRTAFRRRRLRSRSTTRSRPPVPLVCCSFRSWFVSRSFVWFRLFSSAHFVSFVRLLVRSVQFRSFSLCFGSVSSVSF